MHIHSALVFTLSIGLSMVSHAERSRGSSRGRPLIRCQKLLNESTSQSNFVKPLVSRFADVRMRELGRFRGYQLSRSNEEPTHLVELPDLKHGAKMWRIEQWIAGNQPFYFYDVGPRNLELDQARLDAITLAQLQNPDLDGAFLKSSDRRRRDLRYLAQFERAFARRARADFGKAFPSAVHAAPPEILTNADLFGVLDRHLPPSADPRRVAEHLVLTVRLSYDERRNFVGPSLDGVMRELGYNERTYAPLPFLKRVEERHVARLQDEFLNEFGDGPACELSPLFEFRKGLSEELRLRLLLEVYTRARRRKCETIVTSLPAARFIELYGFRAWRSIQLANGRRETLFILQVNTPAFNRGYARLAARLREFKQ